MYEEIMKTSHADTDPDDDEMWQKIQSGLQMASRVLNQLAEENASDFSNMVADAVVKCSTKEKDKNEHVRTNPICLVTFEYILHSIPLIDTRDIYERKGMALKSEWEMGIISYGAFREQVREIKECKEIVIWYLYFIHTKCMRALFGRLETDDKLHKDSEGSAKAALIAIDKSMDAWLKLSFHLPHVEDRILSVQALLQKSRRLLEEQFPNARNFIRPGFDEEVYGL